MADINKKIELDVDSNVDKTTQDFEKLNKVIKETTANFKKLGQLTGVKSTVSDLKKVTKQVDELNKSLFNLGGMLKGVTDLDTKLSNVAKSLGKVSKSTSSAPATRGPYKKSAAQILKEAARRESLEDNTIDKLVAEAITERKKYNVIKDELDEARELRYKNLSKSSGGFKQFSTSSVAAVKTLLESKSVIATLESIVTSLAGGVGGIASRRIGKRYSGQYASIDDTIDQMKEYISRPGVSESTVASGKAFIKERELEKTRLQKKEDAEKAKANAKVAIAAAVIKEATAIVGKFGNVVKDTTGVTLSLKENFSNLVQSIGSIMSLEGGAATYASGSTLYTNPLARTQQMKYGLTNAQNYALSRTMSMMNLKSDEDLMYMNKSQVRLFSSMMEKYSSWYEKMESSGVLQRVQEMQLDIQMFREELAMDFMDWFSENKDTILGSIKNIAKFVMNIADVVCKTTGWIGQGISWLTGQGSSNLSQTMSNSTAYSASSIARYGTNTTNVNINMNNTATGVLSDQSQMEAFFNEKMAEAWKEAVVNLTK